MRDACFKSRPSLHTFQHTPLDQSAARVRAVFLERQDGLVDDFDALSDFILLDDEGRGQADDVAVRGLGQQPVVAEPQTHLPGIVVCNGREGGRTSDRTLRTFPAQHKRCQTCCTRCCHSWQGGDAGCSQREVTPAALRNLHRVTLLRSCPWPQHTEFCSCTAQCSSGTQLDLKINFKKGTM